MEKLRIFINTWTTANPKMTTVLLVVAIFAGTKLANNPAVLSLLGDTSFYEKVNRMERELDDVQGRISKIGTYFVLGRVSDRENVLNDVRRIENGEEPDGEVIERSLLVCDVSIGGGWTNKMRRGCMVLQEYADEKGYHYDSILLRAEEVVASDMSK